MIECLSPECGSEGRSLRKDRLLRAIWSRFVRRETCRTVRVSRSGRGAIKDPHQAQQPGARGWLQIGPGSGNRPRPVRIFYSLSGCLRVLLWPVLSPFCRMEDKGTASRGERSTEDGPARKASITENMVYFQCVNGLTSRGGGHPSGPWMRAHGNNPGP